jgi:hypothetical protein
VAQERRTNAFVIVPPCNPSALSGSNAAIAFEPFDSELTRERTCAPSSGIATAVQHSTIGTSVIDAAGEASALAASTQGTVIHAISSSTFQLGFDIASPRKLRVEAVLSAERIGAIIGTNSSVSLLGSGALPVFTLNVTPGPGGALNTQTLAEDHLLAAGDYTLQATAQAAIDNAIPPDRNGESAYDMQVRLAIPGDVNLDESVDTLDIDVLVAVLLGEDTDPLHVFGADVNGDGGADGLDVGAFVEALIGG